MDATDIAATSTPSPVTYKVLSHRFAAMEQKFVALQRRAARLGCEPPQMVAGEPGVYKVVEQDLDGSTYESYVEYVPVTVTGSAPKLNGWTFLAAVDYEAPAPIFRKSPSMGDREVPLRYRTLGPVCEHCQLSRDRKETFLVEHDDGRVVQVGRTCLKDFLGHDAPENIVALATFDADVRELFDADADGMMLGADDSTKCPGTLNYLAWVVRSVRLWGWLSRAKAHDDEYGRPSTSKQAEGALWEYARACKLGRGDIAARPTEEDRARAELVLDWVKSLAAEATTRTLTDYEHNLTSACSIGYVASKHLGLVASAVATYDREQARSRAVKQEHVGEVGERLRDVRVFVDRVFALEYDDFGRSIVTLRDQEGRVYKWVTAKVPDTGKEYAMTATVKAHDEYKGTLQTVVTRAELVSDDEPTKADLARAETLAHELWRAGSTLLGVGWSNERFVDFQDRVRGAEKATDLEALDALHAELLSIAAVIEAKEDYYAVKLQWLRRLVAAQLAAVAANYVAPKLKGDAAARLGLLRQNLKDAMNEAWHGGYANWSDTNWTVNGIAEYLDTPEAVEQLRADVRAWLADLEVNASHVERGAERRAKALSLLGEVVTPPKGADPKAAKKLADVLHGASERVEWSFAWEGKLDFRSRLSDARDRYDVVALESLRDELVEVASSSTSLAPAHGERYRAEILEKLAATVKKPRKARGKALTSDASVIMLGGRWNRSPTSPPSSSSTRR